MGRSMLCTDSNLEEQDMLRKISIIVAAGFFLWAADGFCQQVGESLDLGLDLGPEYSPPAYRPYMGRHGSGLRDKSRLYLGFSFGEGVYFQYKCTTSCKTATISPADFEFLAGYRISRNWQLDFSAVWAMDFDRYGNRLTYMLGFRPGIRLLLPGLFHRVWYLRAAVPVLLGMSGENDDVLVGFLLGVGVEWRFPVLGIFGEVDFAPYFVEVAKDYYVIPTQGRVGMSFRF